MSIGSQPPANSSWEKPVDYAWLCQAYERDLSEKLRQFNQDDDALQYWVPSEDVAESIASLFASLDDGGIRSATLRLNHDDAQRLDRAHLTRILPHKAVNLEFQAEGDVTILTATFAGRLARKADQSESVPDAVRAREANRAMDRKSAATRPAPATFDPPEPQTLTPALNTVLSGLAGQSARSTDAQQVIQVTGHVGAVCLSLDLLPDGVIVNARHAGTSYAASKHLLDGVCRFSRGRPVQELADHGAIWLANQMRLSAAAVPGIRHARTLDPAFVWLDALTRDAAAQWRIKAGRTDFTNDYAAPPSPEWRAKGTDQQIALLNDLLSSLREQRGLSGDAHVVDIEFDIRAVIFFADDFPAGQKALFLLAAERLFKQHADPRLEVYQQERRDASALRRLKQGEAA